MRTIYMILSGLIAAPILESAAWCQVPDDPLAEPELKQQIDTRTPDERLTILKIKLANGSKLTGQSTQSQILGLLPDSILSVETDQGQVLVKIREIEHIRWRKSRHGPAVGTAIGAITGVLLGAVSYAAGQDPGGSSALRSGEGSAAAHIVGWGLALASAGAIAGNAFSSRRFSVRGNFPAYQRAALYICQ